MCVFFSFGLSAIDTRRYMGKAHTNLNVFKYINVKVFTFDCESEEAMTHQNVNFMESSLVTFIKFVWCFCVICLILRLSVHSFLFVSFVLSIKMVSFWSGYFLIVKIMCWFLTSIKGIWVDLVDFELVFSHCGFYPSQCLTEANNVHF